MKLQDRINHLAERATHNEPSAMEHPGKQAPTPAATATAEPPAAAPELLTFQEPIAPRCLSEPAPADEAEEQALAEDEKEFAAAMDARARHLRSACAWHRRP